MQCSTSSEVEWLVSFSRLISHASTQSLYIPCISNTSQSRSQLSEFCNPTSVAMETEFDHHAVEKLKCSFPNKH